MIDMATGQFQKGPRDVEAFFQWKASNPEMYVLNVKGSKSMLHRADCGHFSFPNGNPKSISAKRFSTNRLELEDWALSALGGICVLCPHCDV
jgi:hypothetical protein